MAHLSSKVKPAKDILSSFILSKKKRKTLKNSHASLTGKKLKLIDLFSVLLKSLIPK